MKTSPGTHSGTHPGTPPASFGERLGNFLRAELAPFPGRLDALVHIAVCICLVVTISLYLQVPFMELSLVVLFYLVAENTLLTYIIAVLIVGGTLVVVSIEVAFTGLTIDYPMLRVALAGVLVFFGMYLLRAGPIIGILGFFWALCVGFLQGNIPLLPNGELMLRLLLWSFVVVAYPALLACVVCTVVRPGFPSSLMPREMIRQLRVVIEQLEIRLHGGEPAPLPPNDVERAFNFLRRQLEFAAIERKEIKRRKNWHFARIATVDRLHIAAAQISRLPVGPASPLSPAACEALRRLIDDCRCFIEAIEDNEPFRLPPDAPVPPSPALGADPAGPDSGPTALNGFLREMGDALRVLSDSADEEYPPFEGPRIPLLRPDAATNPVYIRFALKTVLAAAICVGFYKTVQWEGIHTCMITCVIVALPSLGAMAQKAALRLSGCLLGSVVALLVTVFLLPHLEFAGFLLVSLAVLLPAAWVAVGSPRSNYAGMQFAFAYILALMNGSGPSVSLVEIRDRLIGILVGVVVSTVVHTLVWPERETGELRQNMAKLLRHLAGMAEAAQIDETGERHVRLRIAGSSAWGQLAKSREVRARVELEPEWTARPQRLGRRSEYWFDEAREAILKIGALQAVLRHETTPGGDLRTSGMAYLHAAAQTLNAYADSLESGLAAAPSPLLDLPLPSTGRRDSPGRRQVVELLEDVRQSILRLAPEQLMEPVEAPAVSGVASAANPQEGAPE